MLANSNHWPIFGYWGSGHHQAFMNQKIIPRSATRACVTGVGSPARKYQSFPTCVRMPGVNETLVELPPERGLLATAET